MLVNTFNSVRQTDEHTKKRLKAENIKFLTRFSTIWNSHFLKSDRLYQLLLETLLLSQLTKNCFSHLTLGWIVSNVSFISPSQWCIGLSHHPKIYFFCKVCLQMRLPHIYSTFRRLQSIYSIWEWKSPLGNVEVMEVLVGRWFVS